MRQPIDEMIPCFDINSDKLQKQNYYLWKDRGNMTTKYFILKNYYLLGEKCNDNTVAIL